ncbi:MAG: class I SAM-dependent methyltransferase [Candidatus Falkowbacteria bacterium]
MNQLEEIKKYYEQCDNSYQHWGSEEIYNIHYGFWDDETHSHIEALNNMNRVLAEKVGIKSGDRILDAGCGVGASSIWLAKHYNVEVVGITLSELQCQKATIFAKKEGLYDRVKFYVQDYTKTSFPDKSFDVVWAVESVCHTINKNKFLNETKRLLKAGGRLILADGFIRKESKLDKILLNNWIKRWAIPNLADADSFKKYAEKIGFKNTNFEDISKNILRSSREIFKRGSFGLPTYKLKNKVQIDHVIGCIFQHLSLKADVWFYGVFYAEN